MLPLTGKSASIGEHVKNGVELAVQDIQKSGGSLHPIFEDDKGEAPTAVSVANKLITTDDVHMIIGPVKSDALLAVAPITEKNKTILFSPTAGASTISQAGDFIFRNIELPSAHGEADVAFFKNNHTHKIALFIANASNAMGYGNAVLKSSTNILSITATTTYNQDDTDFRTSITKVLSTKPEGIYLAVATAKDAGILVTQIRELEFKGLILMSVAADAKEFFDTAGVNTENTYVSSPYFDPSVEPSRTYNEEYSKKYNTDSDAFAANAYDATMLVYNATKKCKSDSNTECIRDYLYNTKNYPGVSGPTTFDSNGDVIKPVEIKIAQGGHFVTIK